MIVLFHYLKSCHVVNGTELFSVALERKIRRNKYTFKENRFLLHIREKILVLIATATIVQTTTRDGRFARGGV